MKLLLLTLSLLTFVSCAIRQINNKPQTFTEYVILNKHSDYEGKSKKDWDNQPSENFPGIRLMNWIDKNEK